MFDEGKLSRRMLLAATMVASMPLRAAGRAPDKAFHLLTRPSDLSRKQFVECWLERAAALPADPARKLILSEPLETQGGAIDAVATAWADKGTFPIMPVVPASRALVLTVEEHVLLAPNRAETPIKRTLLIARRAGMTRDAFVRYWLGIHGPLSRGVPGLVGCVFNVVSPSDVEAGVDGVAESWWSGPGTENGGKIASPQADRWAADGENFIDAARTRLFIGHDRSVA